jgi:outer membrane murein-binding lipoprotein Lpp
MSVEEQILERARWEGRIEATQENHTAHLVKLNGSIDRWASASEDLKGAVAGLASDIQEMRAEARLAQERVRVAADTLAAETERLRVKAESERVERAAALEVPVRTWSVRANIWTVVGGVAGLVVLALSVFAILLDTHVI